MFGAQFRSSVGHKAEVLQDAPHGFCPEGVGATGVALHLVGDLARSGSKTCACDVTDAPSWLI
jgi:hypothetical protein